MKDGIVQQTEWAEKSEVIDTEYGDVSVQTWLELEGKRIMKDYSRYAQIRKDRGGHIALFVNDVGVRDHRTLRRRKNKNREVTYEQR